MKIAGIEVPAGQALAVSLTLGVVVWLTIYAFNRGEIDGARVCRAVARCISPIVDPAPDASQEGQHPK
jgi:hypothetical protein